MNTCQVMGCKEEATFEVHGNNAVLPDTTGFQVCDQHLSEAMSHRIGDPIPDFWFTYPIHEGSPPYCASTCPTCHPNKY